MQFLVLMFVFWIVVFSFFGRISASPDEHDKETLKVIRDNMHGLAGDELSALLIVIKLIKVTLIITR